MNFYEIQVGDIPKLEFVHNVERNNYSSRFPNIPNLLEIVLCLRGNIVFAYDDAPKRLFEPNMIAVITKNTACLTYAEKAEIQRHITFGVSVPQQEKMLSSFDLSFSDFLEIEKRVSRNEVILLPHFVGLGEDAGVVKDIISRAHTFFHSHRPEDKINCLSIWFQLCAFLTQVSLKKLRQQFFQSLPSDERYVENAVRYINEHLAEEIRIEQIAKAIELSQGYLQNTFKKVTGFTIIEYINRKKVETVKKLTANRRLTLAEAAKYVGIYDCAYMSRLFKKVTGISFKQYQMIHDKR